MVFGYSRSVIDDPARLVPRRWRRTQVFCSYALVGMVAVMASNLFSPDRGPQHASALESVLHFDEIEDNGVLKGDAAVEFCRLLLQNSEVKLAEVDDLSAVFQKLERIDGQLQELNVMDLKVRREPMSVYLRWHEPYSGREIVWQEGRDENQVSVHAGGWRRRIVPLLRVDPYSEQAQEYSRRPVTQIGLWNFNRRMLSYVDQGCENPNIDVTMTQNVKLTDRACYQFSFVHPEPFSTLEFHRVNIFIDKELGVPVGCELFAFPTVDAPETPVLEESYAFGNLELSVGFTDIDFSIANPEYEFGSD